MDQNKSTFSFEDFEKGLMLAGYISPNNIEEIRERDELAIYDKKVAKQNRETYFKRVVLAAEIVYQMQDEITFGRIKFQKLVYLCEHASEMGLNTRYAKFAAGPFDNKFMHSINIEFKKQKWFKVKHRIDGKYKVPYYERLKNVDNYKGYYLKYFSESSDAINRIISLFRKEKTRQVELVATIYACLLDLKGLKIIINNKSLINKLYSWSKEKAKFKESEIISTFNWMIQNQIIPA